MTVATLAGLRGSDGAERVIDEKIAASRAVGAGSVLACALWARATLSNGMGQYEQALAAASEAILVGLDWKAHVSFHELVEAAARCGQPDTAAATLERLKGRAEPSGSDWAIGILRRSEALVTDGPDAEVLYRDAIRFLSQTKIRPELARAHLLYGEWLRRENRRVDARMQLRTAYDMCTAIGMQAFAERTRRELAATGETVRKRTADTFDALTPQEAHIARLAADGHTNPEIGAQMFISHRTVEFHLRKIFTKVGVTSRRQLREALPRLAAPT